MIHACKKICNECPFSPNSIRGWLAGYTPVELHRIVMNEIRFPCHMTHKHKELSWDMGGTKLYPLCRGALTYMRKNAKQPRDPEVAAIVKSIIKEELDFVMSTPEFLEHHDLSKIIPHGKR